MWTSPFLESGRRERFLARDVLSIETFFFNFVSIHGVQQHNNAAIRRILVATNIRPAGKTAVEALEDPYRFSPLQWNTVSPPPMR